jgi:hypothetical protein
VKGGDINNYAGIIGIPMDKPRPTAPNLPMSGVPAINQFGKCHNETPCIVTLNNKNVFFSKTNDRKLKAVLSGDWYQWEEGGYKKRVKEGEYVNVVKILCMKMKK